MNLKNCPRCGKLFTYNGSSRICPTCLKKEEDEYRKVRDYLWNNPNSCIEIVHQMTGVERDTIINFVKKDKLSTEDLVLDFDLECERCGASISHGRFCENCQKELIEGFSSKYDKENNQSDRAMEEKVGEMLFNINLKNCPRCGKLFVDNGSTKICPTCFQEEENDYQKVKDYLWNNPNSSIELVYQKTGVEKENIIKFIKEDRLIAEGLSLDFDLENGVNREV